MNAVLAETAMIMGDTWDVRPPIFEAEIPTKHGATTVYELWKRFDESEYGKHMDSQPLRFAERYGYNPAAMIKDLGADVVPRLHQYETGLFVAHLLCEERQNGGQLQCSDQEAALVTFTASIHDMGETTHPAIEAEVGATVGDIPSGMKTPENRRIEAAVRSSLYRRLYADVQPEIIERVEAIIAHNDNTHLHEVFETAHTLQSYVTAVRAHLVFEKSISDLLDFANPETPRKESVAIENLGRLSTAVMLALSPKLEECSASSSFAQRVQSIGAAILSQSRTHMDSAYDAYRHAARAS